MIEPNIEPAATEAFEKLLPMGLAANSMAELSIAISLKRIADNLDTITNGNNAYQGILERWP